MSVSNPPKGGGLDTIEECVFCKKIRNERLQYVYPKVVMFEPLNPVTKGHRLFVPVEHVKDAADNLSVSARVFREAAKYVREELGGSANIITSRGSEATQSVFHLHIHVVPRRANDGLYLPWTNQEQVSDLAKCSCEPSQCLANPQIQVLITKVTKEARIEELKRLHFPETGAYLEDIVRDRLAELEKGKE
jgi:histidine triad (HIT) family protein